MQLGHKLLLNSLQEGIDIYFECLVDANPMPAGPIIWRLNEDILEPRQGTDGAVNLSQLGETVSIGPVPLALIRYIVLPLLLVLVPSFIEHYRALKSLSHSTSHRLIERTDPLTGIIQSNLSLVLQKVRRHMSGVYQCAASNQHGIGRSNTIVLNIRHAPYCMIAST